MASLRGIVVGSYGQTIVVTLKDSDGNVQDISAFTGTKQAVARSPDEKKVVTAAASFTTDGTDGKVQFSFASGDIDRPGDWSMQIVLNKTGAIAKSYTFTMDVGVAVS